jgi:hypothetical protein
MRGLYPRAQCSWSQPLTRLECASAFDPPSPTRGEGKEAEISQTYNAPANSLAPGRLLLTVIRSSVIASSLATVLWRIATGLRS